MLTTHGLGTCGNGKVSATGMDLVWMSGAAVLCVLLSVCDVVAQNSRNSPDKPNVEFITIDDLRPEVEGAAAKVQPDSNNKAFDVEVTSNGIDISERGAKVLHYQLATKSLDGKYPRSNYIHPLYDLDGNVLTEDFPADHKWHRGIFWAWHQVLIGEKRIGDPWICQRFQWDVIGTSTKHHGDGSLSIHATLHWKSTDWKPNG